MWAVKCVIRWQAVFGEVCSEHHVAYARDGQSLGEDPDHGEEKQEHEERKASHDLV